MKRPNRYSSFEVKANSLKLRFNSVRWLILEWELDSSAILIIKNPIEQKEFINRYKGNYPTRELYLKALDDTKINTHKKRDRYAD